MTLANRLTVLRIVFAAAMVAALLRESPSWHLAAFALFTASLITDWVDGWVARRTNTTSSFGKVADPVADKILIIGALIGLLRAKLDIPLWGVFLIIARELVMGGLRALAGHHGLLIPADRWGKLKMGIQGGAVLAMLGLLILRERAGGLPAWAEPLPFWLTIVCVVFAWQSAYSYYRQSRRMLEKSWS